MTIIKLVFYIILLILSYFVVCNIVIYLYAQQNPVADADTMVVLGAKVIGTPARPHPTLQSRLDVAIIYLQQNPRTKVIVCGGQGRNESATEASVMADYLIKNGIDTSRIYIEDQSIRTAQQFVFANQILPLGKTIVVTSDFHLLRSIILAKRSGIHDVSGLPASLSNKDKRIALIREPLALLNSLLFDHPMDYVTTSAKQ